MRYLLLILSLVGVAYCILTPLGYMPTCISQGCVYTNDVTFAGISFYHLGTLFFASISLLSLLNIPKEIVPVIKVGSYKIAPLYTNKRMVKNVIADKLLLIVYTVGVSFEIILLIFQVFFFQCLSCQIVAALVILIGFVIIWMYQKNFLSVLVGISCVLLLCAAGKMIIEKYNPLIFGYSGNTNTKVIYFNESSFEDEKFINLVKDEDGSLLFIFYLDDISNKQKFLHIAHKLTTTDSVYSSILNQCQHSDEDTITSLGQTIVHLLFGNINSLIVKNFPLIHNDTVILSGQRNIAGCNETVNPFLMFHAK